MKTNCNTFQKERKYDLLREMQDRVKASGKETFTAYSLASTSRSFGRNPTNLRKDLEQLTREGLVAKIIKLRKIATYKPDGPSSSILGGRILENFKARFNDLKKQRRLIGDNTNFECQRCGRFFLPPHAFLVPLFPVRPCTHCLGNSKLSLGIKIRPRIIQ